MNWIETNVRSIQNVIGLKCLPRNCRISHHRRDLLNWISPFPPIKSLKSVQHNVSIVLSWSLKSTTKFNFLERDLNARNVDPSRIQLSTTKVRLRPAPAPCYLSVMRTSISQFSHLVRNTPDTPVPRPCRKIRRILSHCARPPGGPV